MMDGGWFMTLKHPRSQSLKVIFFGGLPKGWWFFLYTITSTKNAKYCFVSWGTIFLRSLDPYRYDVHPQQVELKNMFLFCSFKVHTPWKINGWNLQSHHPFEHLGYHFACEFSTSQDGMPSWLILSRFSRLGVPGAPKEYLRDGGSQHIGGFKPSFFMGFWGPKVSSIQKDPNKTHHHWTQPFRTVK